FGKKIKPSTKAITKPSTKPIIKAQVRDFSVEPLTAEADYPSDASKPTPEVNQFSNEAKSVMWRWLVDLSQGGIWRLRRDFYKLRKFTPPHPESKKFSANLNLCRYKDVTCYDNTRVVLNWPADCKNDFIHANWMRHELLSCDFICTQ
ncbi:unnamed protein product, partial [Thelazia callipaeda]|uniref:Tyrosine-protein phosphatase domain-containing protein n=1 Tax=Thelazia callipaeda TaxID=103827 RepID=A0A0N5CTU7_THECL